MVRNLDAVGKTLKTIRVFGGLMLIGGVVFSVLPFVITGPGAGVIDPYIVIGPFILVAGLITYAVGVVGAWRAKRRE